MEIKKLFAVDVDGTLLPKGESELPAFSRDFLHDLQKEGYWVVLLSGRPYRAMEKAYKALGGNTPLVSYNGQQIRFPGEKTLTRSFPLSSVKRFIANAKGHFHSIQAESEDTIFRKEENKFLNNYFPLEGMKIEVGEVEEIVSGEPMSLVLQEDLEELPFLKETAELEEGISLRAWSTCPYCELYIPWIHKGSALAIIKERYGLSKEDVIAFGDSNNDFEMLNEAGLAFTMKDSQSQLLRESFPLTEFSSREDGVAREIKRILGK